MPPPTTTPSPPRNSTPIPIPVLLLKTKSTPTDNYEAHFSRAGRFAPQFVPVLQHNFHAANLQKLRRLLQSIEDHDGACLRDGEKSYGGLIFTSQRAVEAFARVVGEVASNPTPNPTALNALALPLYAVGPATSRALSALTTAHLPSCTILGADTGTGENLAAFILQHYHSLHPPPSLPRPDHTSHPTKPKLLFLVGEQRRDIIPRTLGAGTLAPERRIGVEEMVVYESGLLGSFAGDVAGVLEGGVEGAETVWVVVFSPTGCEELLGVLGVGRGGDGGGGSGGVGCGVVGMTGGGGGGGEEGYGVAGGGGPDGGERRRRGKIFVATIGPTTRDYLVREFAFEPDVCAERPSPEGVEEGIRRFMEERGMIVG